jgi:rod shape determining protein RodA
MVAAQPDLGTALVLAPVLLAILWVAGASIETFARLGIAGGLLGAIGLRWFLEDYQRERLLVFFGRAGEGSADGYQLAQSMIAIGSGGPTGKGLFLGVHHDLGYLPEDHNDFIFGVIGEEWGLLGTLLVVALHCALYLLVLRVAWQSREPFGRLAAVGICAWLASQTIVNLGMTLGLLPVTGLPLPFVSFGGTSMMVTMLALGIVIAIALRPVESLHPGGLRSGTAERVGPRKVITIRPRASTRG